MRSLIFSWIVKLISIISFTVDEESKDFHSMSDIEFHFLSIVQVISGSTGLDGCYRTNPSQA